MGEALPSCTGFSCRISPPRPDPFWNVFLVVVVVVVVVAEQRNCRLTQSPETLCLTLIFFFFRLF